MKTLVIQLARLGDIYMTWPVVRALKDQDPQGTVDILVRPRFASACMGLESLNQVHFFPTQDFLEPLTTHQDLKGSLAVVDSFLEKLKSQNYDRVINLSYSEVSSYVVSFLDQPQMQVMGYSRHSDGFLHLKDDVSRYFWAQVGPGGFNQIHLIDLLAGTAGVELHSDNFKSPQIELKARFSFPYYVVHVGGSESHKRLSADFWIQIIDCLLKESPESQVVLVGAEAEKGIADRILQATQVRVINLVGQTQIIDLFSILKYGQGLLGGDSVPMHMVPFVNQRAFCFSVGEVNPFETGPITSSSWILRAQSENSWSFGRVKEAVRSWVRHETPPQNFPNLLVAGEQFPRVQLMQPQKNFSWDLLKAIYMGEAFPVAEDLNFYRGALRMYEAAHVSFQNLKKRDQIKSDMLTALLDRIDEVLGKIATEVPDLYPLFRWYQAEKTRIAPGRYHEMVEDQKLIVAMFQNLLRNYLLDEDIKKAENHAGV